MDTTYDKRMTPVDFQGQGSKVKVTCQTLLLNLVNTIQTEPFQLGPSNLVHILLMTNGRHLLIFKVMGSRVKATRYTLLLNLVNRINPFSIANYNFISFLNSTVGRILQRWRCSCFIWNDYGKRPYGPWSINSRSLIIVDLMKLCRKWPMMTKAWWGSRSEEINIS